MASTFLPTIERSPVNPASVHIAADAGDPKPAWAVVAERPCDRWAARLQREPKLGRATLWSTDTFQGLLDLLGTHSPPLLLLDLDSVDVGGEAGLQYIRATFPDLFMVVLSSQSQSDYRSACYNAGVNIFLNTPASVTELAAIVYQQASTKAARVALL